MYKGMKVSVVMPAYNEEKSIGKVVKGYKTQKYVDEVLVINNNSADKTVELAKKAGARVVNEQKQGYGYACMRGFREAVGEILILTESDGTFEPRDVEKLLAYVKEVDLVLGTRTNPTFIKKDGINLFLRIGNILMAKFIYLLFSGPYISDVGCTLRAIKRGAFAQIEKELEVGGSHFSPEMIIKALKKGLLIVEIPVSYKARIGKSKITGDYANAIFVGFNMLLMILKERFLSWNR